MGSVIEMSQNKIYRFYGLNTFAKGMIGAKENLTALEVGQIYN